MQKKKKHIVASPPEHDTEKLALVKAAAWAWHQHSSSSMRKQSLESPSTPPRRRSVQSPSRYRLESLSKSDCTDSPFRIMSEKKGPSTLLDLHEIERISEELNGFVVAGERREKTQEKKVQMRKSIKVGRLFGRHAVNICGSPETMAETEALVSRPSERCSGIRKNAVRKSKT